MKAEEYKGAFGPFLAVVKNEDGLVAMFRHGSSKPIGIHETRLPLIQKHLKDALARTDLPVVGREDSELTLNEIERAIEEIQAFRPT
jgi:hypothetical protein